MRRGRLAPAAVALVVALAPRVAAGGEAVVPAVPLIPFGAPTVTACWYDVRLFDTLRHGRIDYCRENLRYRPGALECHQFTDQVCSVFLPGSGLVETRSPVHSHVFRCPGGPEPPVCRRLTLR